MYGDGLGQSCLHQREGSDNPRKPLSEAPFLCMVQRYAGVVFPQPSRPSSGRDGKGVAGFAFQGEGEFE